MPKTQKYSFKRERIFDVLCAVSSHPSAEWIHAKLKAEIPDLSLGTVYRNLAAFRQEGKIVSVGVVQGQERYDGNVEPHTHFVCDVCGNVYDLADVQYDETSAVLIEEKYHLHVDYYSLVFHGKCAACKEAATS